MDFEEEIKTLQTEYQKLQAHLADVEVTYQSQLTELNQRQANDFALQLQGIVSSLFGKSQYSDMNVLLSNGEALPVHKLILLARSQNWGTYDFEKQSQLDLRDYRHEVAFDMLKWVYTDRLDIEDDVGFIIELLQIASSYNLLSLHKRCQKMLIPLITLDNCKLLAEEAGKCEAQLLQEQCTEFILKNQDKLEKDEDEMLVEEEPDIQNIKLPYLCYPCKISIHDPDQLSAHCYTNHKKDVTFMCGICCETMVVNFSRKYCTLNTGRSFVCKPCLKKSTDQIKKIHTWTPWNCGICGKMCNHSFQLIEHLKVHSGEKPFQCEICGNRFSSKSSMEVHVERTHKNVRKHECTECGKKFLTGPHLKRHQYIHSGEKPFQCSECGRCFRQINTLQAHMRTHTGEKPFSCDECDKAFADRRSLMRHKNKNHGVF